jgi:hypothetical protein
VQEKARMAFCQLQIVSRLLSAIFLFLSGPCAAQNFRVPSTKFLSGVVKDALGRPLARSNLTLKSMDGKVVGRTTTDSRGVFRFKEPGAG